MFSRLLLASVATFMMFGAHQAFAFKVRCTAKQDSCQVVTSTLTVGDYLGFFDPDGYLSAVGKVVKIHRGVRKVKILKHYQKIRNSHEAMLIKDREAARPSSYFKFFKRDSENSVGLRLGIVDMGIGQGVSATKISGFKEWPFKKRAMSLVATGSFMSGSGRATDVGAQIETHNINFMAFSALGGVRYMFRPEKPISQRVEGGLGLVHLSGKAGNGQNFERLVDGRVKPGLGLMARIAGSLYFRWGSTTRPFLGAEIVRLQSSLDYGLFAGFRF